MIHSRSSLRVLVRFFSHRKHIFAPYISYKNNHKTHEKVRLSSAPTVASWRFRSCCVGSPGQTVGAFFEKWRREFELKSISEPQESIEYILAHCLGTTRIPDVYKFREKLLSPDDIEKIDSLCQKRLKRMPIQYVLGEWCFRQLTLQLSPPVFIPRPETEELIDIVLPEIARKPTSHILDLCCGSGAIALSLLKEQNEVYITVMKHPNTKHFDFSLSTRFANHVGIIWTMHNNLIKATAVDQSKAACQLTKANAQRSGLNNRIRVVHSRLEEWRCREAKFDIIVSNPPYVFREDLDELQAEIRLYEDLRALDGGEFGLEVIKAVLEISSRCLDESGKLFLEVEPRHPGLLADYLLENNGLGLSCAQTHRDFNGKDRFVEIIRKRNS